MSRNTVKPLIIGIVLVLVFLLLSALLPRFLDPEAGQSAQFFMRLIAIVGGYICFVAFMSRLLSGRVSERVYGLFEKLCIAGILLGILGMFQPWVQILYPMGFVTLFAVTWIFTLWGYVTPKSAHGTE